MTDHVVEIVKASFFRISAVVLLFCDVVWRLATGAASLSSNEPRNSGCGSHSLVLLSLRVKHLRSGCCRLISPVIIST